jgi:hypothetical protein
MRGGGPFSWLGRSKAAEETAAEVGKHNPNLTEAPRKTEDFSYKDYSNTTYNRWRARVQSDWYPNAFPQPDIGKNDDISDDEKEWTQRNNDLPYVEHYASDYTVQGHFSYENGPKRKEQMEEDEKKFKTKADKKPYNQKTRAYFETTIIRATNLIDQGTKLGKTIEAYDKIKEAATILRDIAETMQVIQGQTLLPSILHRRENTNTLSSRREDVWIKALEAYNKLKEVVPRYRGDMISKLDTITNNISYWIEFNGDYKTTTYPHLRLFSERIPSAALQPYIGKNDKYETETSTELWQRYGMGGKSKRRKFKRRSTKRRKSKRRR